MSIELINYEAIETVLSEDCAAKCAFGQVYEDVIWDAEQAYMIALKNTENAAYDIYEAKAQAALDICMTSLEALKAEFLD